MYTGLLVLLVILFVALGPWFTILMLNALFDLGVSLSFGTYFAAFWLNFMVVGGAISKGNKQ